MKKVIKYKFLILSIYIFILILILKSGKAEENIKQNKISSTINYNTDIIIKQKVCICTLGKLENRYIREFVIHYEKYGVDKIFLYDNNDINGERFETVIGDFVEKGLVQIQYSLNLFIVFFKKIINN